jgi:hypothetical protein
MFPLERISRKCRAHVLYFLLSKPPSVVVMFHMSSVDIRAFPAWPDTFVEFGIADFFLCLTC